MSHPSTNSPQARAQKQSWSKPTLTSLSLGDAEATKTLGVGELLISGINYRLAGGS
jgi:hypothetical protein